MTKKPKTEQTGRKPLMIRTIRPERENFHVRAEGDAKGAVRISGYANKFGLDSYGTRVDPGSVKLDRFSKNSILLFNHDVDCPIGKVTKIEQREDGIFVECELSQSTNERVSYIRDLVREGCLKTFSIRFDQDAKMEPDKDNPGKYLIRNWELQEVSIVALPAQPDSTFSMRNGKALLTHCRSLDEARTAVANVRGAKLAKYAADKMKEAVEAGASEDELMASFLEASGLEAPVIASILNGEVTPAPEAFLKACSEVLGCPEEELAAMNAEDEAAPEETPLAPALADEPPVDGAMPEAEKPVLEIEDEMQACVAGKIPDLMKSGKTQEDAVAVAISMCSEERGQCGWRPSEADVARFIEAARQASQDPTGPTVPVQPLEMNENPMLQKLDTLAALLGSLVMEVQGLKQIMNGTAPKAEPMSEEKPVTPPVETEKASEETPTIEDEEAMRTLVDGFTRLEARLQTLSL